MDKFKDIDYWKGIVLYGLNQATYKIALGKTILQLAGEGKERVHWSHLSNKFLDNYIDRLKNNNRPQQRNPARKTKMERIIESLNIGLINYETAINQVGLTGFNDVIPRFQTIGRDKEIVGERFYHFDFGQQLYLHDSTFIINEQSNIELLDELDTRWSLLEGAFSIDQGGWQLSNNVRDIYLENGYLRSNLTNSIPFLQGYQGNTCFYCGQEMDKSDIHVDHLLPRQFLQHDEIWNLVLCHSVCNLNKSDALVRKHYLEKIIVRNENIMGSNHPWKNKISDSIGSTQQERAKSIWYHYENARIVLRSNYWENPPSYKKRIRSLLSTLGN